MIFVSSNMYFGSNDNDHYSDAENVFYSNPTTVTTINQDRQKRNDNLHMTSNVNFNGPLGKKNSFRIEEMFNYFKDGDKLNTYEWNPVSGKYEILNNDLSNELNRKGIKNNATISLDLNSKAAHISPGISLQSINIKNRFLKNPGVNQEYFYAFPSLTFFIKNFNGGYRVQINEPSAYDLQPVVDNSDPLYQNFGNTELVPAIQHMFNMGFNKYNEKRSLSFSINSNMTFIDHSVIRERSVDSRGVRITKPVNVNGSGYVYLNFGMSKQYKFKNNLQISIRPALNFNYSKSFIIVNTIKSSYINLNLGGFVTWTINWNDIVELNQRYNVTKQKSNYGSSSFQNLSFISHFSTTEFVVRLPKNWVWESSLDHRYNQQSAPGFSKNIFRWNAGINYLFLKEKKGQARLYVYDILKQNTSALREVSENFILDIESNTLTRFFLISFTYNIRDFKGGKVGSRNNFFWF